MLLAVIKIYLKPNMQANSVCSLSFLLMNPVHATYVILHLATEYMHISFGLRNTTNVQIMSANSEHGQQTHTFQFIVTN